LAGQHFMKNKEQIVFPGRVNIFCSTWWWSLRHDNGVSNDGNVQQTFFKV